ncbi:glycosyl transferase [Scheffersomyces coipomensis]|uniref:glycosyl transferase n=1 Tax=Scheffersomyces coipomensis TaxID=1788519 RepID=UPI00315CDD89
MVTLLVTTGATVTFKELVRNVLQIEFIRGIIDLGFNEVFVQYGNEIKDNVHQSDIFVQQVLKELNSSDQLNFNSYSDSKASIVGFPDTDKLQLFTSSKLDLKLYLFPFSTNVNAYINRANLVISHAGTGSIIDSLKLHKKLIVVINDQLMDNHQAEVAEEFCKQGYCSSLTTKDIKDGASFVKAVRERLAVESKPFTTSKSNVIEAIIYEELAA